MGYRVQILTFASAMLLTASCAWANRRPYGTSNLGDLPPQCVMGFRQVAQFPARKLKEIRELKVGTYNLSDYFGERDVKGVTAHVRPGYDIRAKAEHESAALVRALKEAELDVITVQEVGSRETLEELAVSLGGQYHVLSVSGNDPSSRTIGFLVKKDLPLSFQLVSNRNLRDRDGRRIFMRDLPVLTARPAGASAHAPPLFLFLGTHHSSAYRSQNSLGQYEIQAQQSETIAQVVRELEGIFGQETPILVGGDFQGSPSRSGRHSSLELTGGLRDVFDLSPTPLQGPSRFTAYTSGSSPRSLIGRQSDGILLNEANHNLVRSAEVVRPRDATGQVQTLPRDRDDLIHRFGSDHFLVKATLDFEDLYRRWRERLR